VQGKANSHLQYPRSELWQKMIRVNYQFSRELLETEAHIDRSEQRDS